MKRFFAQALVIARRDFGAIVLTPTFLIFLLAPLFMMAVATIGSLGAVKVAQGKGERVVVLADDATASRLRMADQRLRGLAGRDLAGLSVDFRAPDAVARHLLGKNNVSAVLTGDREVIFEPDGARNAEYLALLVHTAASSTDPKLIPVETPHQPSAKQDRSATAFGAVLAMFLLTIILASQSISMLAEERNNKVIEILAAAVPLEAVFLGKLVGMLGVAILFSLFWFTLAGVAASLGVAGLSLAAITPAIGLPAFAFLFAGYFMFAFLLLGAVFLGVGAQAATMREIQMLSLPVTIFQVSMFALASAGTNDPDGTIGIVSAIVPYSSPFAMAARAANGVPAWQYLAAFAWQLLWLAITVTVAARLFRRGVLKSGISRR